MCGIVGLTRPSGLGGDEEQRLREAVAALDHRGPDGHSVFVDRSAGLGHTRLSIIDVAGGAQPMANETGDIVVVFNGEIWNYRQLRDQLRAAGHAFVTECDTEVIVHGFEEWGVDLPRHLDGMFAYAVWDQSAQRLVLARDRMGKKPVYFSRLPGAIAFGSDARSVLIASGRAPRLNADALPEFLLQRYVTAPRTLFDGVEKLRPGHQLLFQHDDLSIAPYWALGDDEPESLSVQELRGLLARAVERRLMSDVPLGAFLSGGVDSSIVVALMAEAGMKSFPTFTIGFDNPIFDERSLARETAALVGSEHHEVVVSANDFADALPRLVWARDEPLAEPSEIPLLLLAEFASRHVKVVLSGDGGDELFGGYPKYRADRLIRSGLVPGAAVRLFGPALQNRVTHRRLARAVESAQIRNDRLRWASWFRSFSAEEIRSLVMPEVATGGSDDALAAPLAELIDGYQRLDPVRLMLAGDLLTYLPDNMLARGDRVLMAASVEGRMPLLDKDVVERVNRAPAKQRVGFRSGKKLLREVAEGLVPRAVLESGKKGFPVPVASLLLDEKRDLGRRILLSERTLDRGILRPDAIHSLFDADVRESSTTELQLFTLAALELWLRANVDQVTATPPSSLDELLADEPSSARVSARS